MSVITPFDKAIFDSAPEIIRVRMNAERRLAGLPEFTAPENETLYQQEHRKDADFRRDAFT